MVREELRVPLGRKVREEAVLAGGEGKAPDVFAGDGLSVQADGAVVAQQAQDALHERGLAGAVFSEQADYLAGLQLKVYIVEHLFGAESLVQFVNFEHFIPPWAATFGEEEPSPITLQLLVKENRPL